MNAKTPCEMLFTVEFDLRTASINYSADRCFNNARLLRHAAIKFARISWQIDRIDATRLHEIEEILKS